MAKKKKSKKLTEAEVLGPMNMSLDPKEDAEREEAATRYMGESPDHFVEYAEACEHESLEGSVDLRADWDDAYDAYLNELDTGPKEDWQSDVVTNKPFTTVQHAKSVIRKALTSGSYAYYNLLAKRQYTNSAYAEELINFGNIVFDEFQGQHQGDFITAFIDACEMAFITGQSFEMIPIFEKGKFEWELTPPWDIFRDPYALPRQPQSGNYWIRRVWMDKWELKLLEKRGIFQNIDAAISSEKGSESSGDEEADSKKRKADAETNKFLSTHRVMDFYGRIIAPSGEQILDRGRFTISGNTIIRAPQKVPYDTLRWPGTSFSAIPGMLRFEGRGILDGVLALWELFNNLLNLHVDNLNWQINNVWERNPDMLADPTDNSIFPGKFIERKAGADANAPAHRPLLTKSSTAEALGNMQYLSGLWDEGSLTPNTVTGLPGYRQEVTKGEYDSAKQTSMGVFESMAKDLEVGGKQALWAAYEIIMIGLKRDHDIMQAPEIPEEIREHIYSSRKNLSKYADLQMTGVTDMINRSEMLQKIELAMMKADHPVLGRYMKPYKLLKAYYEILDLDKYDAVVNSDEAKQVDEQVAKQRKAQSIIGATNQSNPKIPQ